MATSSGSNRKTKSSGPLDAQLITLLKTHQEDSYETRRKREDTLRETCRLIAEKFGLQKLDNLSRKHVLQVVETWKQSGNRERTIANKLTHLRWLVRKIGKQNLLPTENSKVGVEPGPRYTHAGEVVAPEVFTAALNQAGMREKALLMLGREFGMRFKEAALFRPHRDVQGDRIYLTRGTKGGRPRYLWIHSERQHAVLENLMKMVEGKDRCLIPKEQNYKAFKQAVYTSLRELGIGRNHAWTFHDLRRTFAVDEMDRLVAKGHSEAEAAKIVSKQLGHNRIEVINWYVAQNPASEPTSNPV